MTGTNIGTGNYVSPVILKQRGYNLVRLVSLPSAVSYIGDLRNAGIATVAVVIPAQSGGYVVPNADVYQMDNERDMDMSPESYQSQATFYQRTYPNLTWISCGMSSGISDWWQGVQNAGGLPGFSGFGVHPYGKSPAKVKLLLAEYIAITPDMPCWVTEWNRPEDEIPAMQKVLREDCVHDLWFCSDCGVPGFSEAPLILHAG